MTGFSRVAAALAVLPLLVAGCDRDDERPDTLQTPTGYAAVETVVGQLSARFPEATDTAVRESVFLSVYCSVVHDEPVPTDFAMFSAAGDQAVRSVVVDFVIRTRATTSHLSKRERIEAVWGDSWKRDFYAQRSDCRSA